MERRLTRVQAVTQTAAQRWERTQLVRVDINCQRWAITVPLTLVHHRGNQTALRTLGILQTKGHGGDFGFAETSRICSFCESTGRLQDKKRSEDQLDNFTFCEVLLVSADCHKKASGGSGSSPQGCGG